MTLGHPKFKRLFKQHFNNHGTVVALPLTFLKNTVKDIEENKNVEFVDDEDVEEEPSDGEGGNAAHERSSTSRSRRSTRTREEEQGKFIENKGQDIKSNDKYYNVFVFPKVLFGRPMNVKENGKNQSVRVRK